MREIEFRGLFRNKKMVYGRMCQDKILDKEVWYMQSGDIMKDNEYYEYEVDLNTIGQYTGLKDKNGKKIFENDILSFDNNDIKFKGIACYYVSFENGYWCGLDVKKDRKLFCHNFRFKHTEIIGNIHQDKHLLK